MLHFGLWIVVSYSIFQSCFFFFCHFFLKQLVTATKDLSSHLQDLQHNMDSLKVEHGHEQTVLAEIHSLLSATMEAQSRMSVSKPVQMVSSEVQTSPGLVERFCVVSEEKRVFQGVRLCGPSATCILAKSSDPAVGLTSSSKQANTRYDQTVPTRTALCPLPSNQEGHVVHMPSDDMSERLWQQSFCSQALKAPRDADIVSGTTLPKPRGQYALGQGALPRSCIVDSMQEDSQMVAITGQPQDRVMPAREEVVAPAFAQRGPQKIRSKKWPRGRTRALIPQNIPTVYRGSGQRNVLHRSRADDEEEQDEGKELSQLYQTEKKASCENTKPSFMLKQNKEVSMWSRNTKPGVNRKTKGKAKSKAKAWSPQNAEEGLWNLFSFEFDSD